MQGRGGGRELTQNKGRQRRQSNICNKLNVGYLKKFLFSTFVIYWVPLKEFKDKPKNR